MTTLHRITGASSYDHVSAPTFQMGFLLRGQVHRFLQVTALPGQ